MQSIASGTSVRNDDRTFVANKLIDVGGVHGGDPAEAAATIGEGVESRLESFWDGAAMNSVAVSVYAPSCAALRTKKPATCCCRIVIVVGVADATRLDSSRWRRSMLVVVRRSA